MSGFIDRVPITKEPKRENLMQGSCCQREVKVQRGGKGNPEITTSKKPVVGGQTGEVRSLVPRIPREPQEDHLASARNVVQSRKTFWWFSSH